jgi:glyoxylase-like metal-dependent hydrolase (beta-lactamase superfamily II)
MDRCIGDSHLPGLLLPRESDGRRRRVLIPVRGGETSDALMVYLPASGVLFAGDVLMPYLGVPFFAEGSPEGLLDTLRYIRELAPRQLTRVTQR